MDQADVTLKTFKHGEFILREGEKSEHVYQLVSGKVDVIRHAADGEEVLLAELHAGEVFGEMGLIDAAPCSASVRAHGKVTVNRFGRDEFMTMLQQDIESVSSVLQALFDRMRNMNRRVISLETQLKQVHEGEEKALKASLSGEVTIAGLTKPTRHALDEEGRLVISSFPFRIGRFIMKGRSDMFSFMKSGNDVQIHDIPPYVVSRKHCRIEKKRDGYYLVDDASRMGTWVGGTRIGKSLPNNTRYKLESGKHRIALGDRDSQFVFEVVIP